jgi:hypothetical protein
MTCYISFRDLLFTDSGGGVTVVVITDSPAHLYARISDVEPQIHKKTSYIRGLPLMDDSRFCFVVFNDIEQDESGDTLAHTFTFPDWLYCMTRWIYFWGKKAGEPCVSTSPIFKHHNNVPVWIFYTIGYPPIVRASSNPTGWGWLCHSSPSPYAGGMSLLEYNVRTIESSPLFPDYVGTFRQQTPTLWKCINSQLVDMMTLGYHQYTINWPVEANDIIGVITYYAAFDCDMGGLIANARSHSVYPVFTPGVNVLFDAVSTQKEISVRLSGHT